MRIRARSLSEGWYPGRRNEVEAMLGAWGRVDEAANAAGAVSAVAPHAGWYFSGRIAWSAWRSAREADAVVILGGHLPAGAPFRYWAEDGYETPSGIITADAGLRDALASRVDARPDAAADNTVEVHLPMAAARLPGLPVACFRVPGDLRAAEFGEALAEYQESSGRRLFVLGSTDLTHYGKPYGFEPAGPGQEGFAWARKADEAIIESFLAMDAALALERARDDGSACSVGAAVAAMAFASRLGADGARLLMRGSSDEKTPGADASVGYCSVAFLPPL